MTRLQTAGANIAVLLFAGLGLWQTTATSYPWTVVFDIPALMLVVWGWRRYIE